MMGKVINTDRFPKQEDNMLDRRFQPSTLYDHNDVEWHRQRRRVIFFWLLTVITSALIGYLSACVRAGL